MDAANENEAPGEHDTPPMCPSAQPFMDGAFAFGVVQGPSGERRVAYLEERVEVTDRLLALSGPVKPTEVFRFAAPCAASKCQHYDGHDCQLANKLVQLTPAVTKALPACTVRPECRWWRQEGKAACMRCPSVRTVNYVPSEDQRKAADPAFQLAATP